MSPPSLAERGIRVAALLLAVAAAILLLHRIHDFSQQRFFTIDEYQFGHATWLVSQGQVPYRDFYEHHFPLSYVLHAPLLAPAGGFDEKALRLRAIAFAYLLVAAAAMALATLSATRDPRVAVLAGVLPLGFGFALMSEVEYRADNFGAAILLVFLALLESNRRLRRRSVAALCGALLVAAVLMTQKAVYFGGGALALMLAVDFLRRGRRSSRLIEHPLVLAATTGGLFLACVGAAGALGILGRAFDLTVADAVRHEWTYQRVPLGRFLPTYLRETGVTTALILAGAACHLVLGRDRFWWYPTAAVLLAGSLIRAQYPYNYVLACWLLVLCAVRGWDDLLRRMPRAGGLGVARPLLLLAPLLLLPDQLAFVERAGGNEDQLRLMRKIERFTDERDVVIDGGGGALFRPHASYFYYHGGAQRQLFADYFERELVEDYRRSGALFWIRDVRLRSLPETVQRYFRDHYVRADGDLYALGFRIPATRDRPGVLDVDVVRGGEYRLVGPPGAAPVGPVLSVGGRPLRDGTIRLEVGRHRVELPAGSPARILTPLPAQVFHPQGGGGGSYSPLLDYGQ